MNHDEPAGVGRRNGACAPFLPPGVSRPSDLESTARDDQDTEDHGHGVEHPGLVIKGEEEHPLRINLTLGDADDLEPR